MDILAANDDKVRSLRTSPVFMPRVWDLVTYASVVLSGPQVQVGDGGADESARWEATKSLAAFLASIYTYALGKHGHAWNLDHPAENKPPTALSDPQSTNILMAAFDALGDDDGEPTALSLVLFGGVDPARGAQLIHAFLLVLNTVSLEHVHMPQVLVNYMGQRLFLAFVQQDMPGFRHCLYWLDNITCFRHVAQPTVKVRSSLFWRAMLESPRLRRMISSSLLWPQALHFTLPLWSNLLGLLDTLGDTSKCAEHLELLLGHAASQVPASLAASGRSHLSRKDAERLLAFYTSLICDPALIEPSDPAVPLSSAVSSKGAKETPQSEEGDSVAAPPKATLRKRALGLGAAAVLALVDNEAFTAWLVAVACASRTSGLFASRLMMLLKGVGAWRSKFSDVLQHRICQHVLEQCQATPAPDTTPIEWEILLQRADIVARGIWEWG